MRLILPSAMLILALLIIAAGCVAPSGSPTNTTPPMTQSTFSLGPGIGQVPVRTVPVDDIEVAYKEIGQGEPLLFIIGSGSTMDLWPPAVLANFSETNRVIVFDNRGMGCTTATDKPFSIELFADDTAGLMDALNISRANVLGWSMGADIAQELALRHPEKIDRLILYGGTCGGAVSVPPEPSVIEKLSNTSGSAQEQGERLFTLLFPASWLREHPDPRTYFPIPNETSPPESYARQAEAIATWNGTCSLLAGIRSPTLVLTGTEDVISPPANAFVIGERIPGAWVIQVPGGGHGMMYQYPDQFERIVTVFLETG
jgi:pimeloyl-ACP methyl ester carboxylesterase